MCARSKVSAGTEMSARRALPMDPAIGASGIHAEIVPWRLTHPAFSPTRVQIIRADHPVGTALFVKAPSLTRSVEMISCAELVLPSEPTKPASPSMHAFPSVAQRPVLTMSPFACEKTTDFSRPEKLWPYVRSTRRLLCANRSSCKSRRLRESADPCARADHGDLCASTSVLSEPLDLRRTCRSTTTCNRQPALGLCHCYYINKHRKQQALPA